MATLTAAKAKALASPGMHHDGRGLYLRVAAGGSKSWIHRVTVDGRRRDIGLGGYPTVSLAKARQLAEANRAAIAGGRDPLSEKRRGGVPTFEEAAVAVHKANLPRWRNPKHAAQWLVSLEQHAYPIIGKLPVHRIERQDVLAILTPMWSATPETARRVRQRIRAVLKWAMAHGYVEHNAAGEAIDGALPALPRVVRHYRAMEYREVPAALAAIEASGASLAVKACLRWLILTACRSGEALGAAWAEIDEPGRLWVVPAERMKASGEHRVPLSDAALSVLDQVRLLRGESGLLFPSPTRAGARLCETTMGKLLRSTGLVEKTTIHGLRSSFRDWCAETGKPRELAEAALAHTVGGVEGAYFRSDLLDRRRALMAEWARYLAGDTATVVKLRA